MTPADLLRLARILVAGLASRAWRLVVGGPCPCEFCREIREFRDGDDPGPRSTFLPTLDEVRRRRGV